MRWGYFALILVAVAVVQSTVLSLVRCPPWVDLLLVVALSCAWLAPGSDARIAGWLAGLMHDGLADHPSPMGLHALALGLATMLLARLREMVNHELWWARWIAGFAAAWPAQLLVLIHARALQQASLSTASIVAESLLTAISASLLAALVAAIPARRNGLGRQRHPTLLRW